MNMEGKKDTKEFANYKNGRKKNKITRKGNGY